MTVTQVISEWALASLWLKKVFKFSDFTQKIYSPQTHWFKLAKTQAGFIFKNNEPAEEKTTERTRLPDDVRQSLLEKKSKNIMLKKLNEALEKQIREVQAERMMLEHRSRIY